MFSANIPRLFGHIIVQFTIIQYIFIIWTGTLEKLHNFFDELNNIHPTTKFTVIHKKNETAPLYIYPYLRHHCLCEGQPDHLEPVQEAHGQVSVPADQLMPSSPCH